MRSIDEMCSRLQTRLLQSPENALSFDVRERGYSEAAKRILLTPNPTTLPGSAIPPKEKLYAVKALSEDDIAALLHHLGKTRHYDVFAAVTLAWLLGVRPCEMHSIQVTREGFHIIGGRLQELSATRLLD
ncbi:hypothetical protein UMZ34_21075 [Halopseudomonas pachastrellae]|nr:hypothetical protein UMZ34_21075 [Halopseudomonas pachastrellae]